MNLAKKMERLLPEKVMELLRLVGGLAKDESSRAFIVGGIVRDIILGLDNLDIDIVIEGDGIEFAKSMARETGGGLVTYEKFGTATVMVPRILAGDGRFRVDIATARRERYRRPAALPDVEFASIKDDLYRRDFTINAMAVSLSGERFGELIDFFGGVKDLSDGVISALHEKSFMDDPTRIFRAVRFEQRFGFRIDGRTERLIKKAIVKEVINITSPARIRDELLLILEEEDPGRAIMRMRELDELRFIHPAMRLGRDSARLMEAIKGLCRWYGESTLNERPLDKRLLYLMALFEALSKKAAADACARFQLKRSYKEAIFIYKEKGAKTLLYLSRRQKTAPSDIYRRLEALPFEVRVLLLAKAKDGRTKRRIVECLTKYSRVRPRLSAGELKGLGFEEGPRLGKALRDILYARLDGKIETKEDERAFARRLLE